MSMRDRIYYAVKPYLPLRLRLALRRLLAVRTRQSAAAIWPIHEAAGKAPRGWTGWPEDDKFPFVVTHDVEGKAGLARVKRLAELEMSIGIRSSFNFVPEGEYEVPESLLLWLRERGFEVGVHDLKHDGRLYKNKESFENGAGSINRYLKQWGCAGFRSGFMRHQLDWMHSLDIEYDASTFDTDPMEPQPDAAGTIFPFWVPNPDENAEQRGYAELPYTLPQDSTLFLLLKEPTSKIWTEKLEWIARRKGMALVNVHPDYLRFEDEPDTPGTYPIARYMELLSCLGSRYAGRAWNALPVQVARHVAAMQPVFTPRAAKRVCLVTYSFYERDARVSRYGRALAERGDEVDVLALRAGPSAPRIERLGGCQLIRIQDRALDEKSPLSFLVRLVKFLLRSSFWLARNHLRRPYDVIHVHNVPDFLVFSALIPKIFGAKVILDIHDIVPELYQSKFQVSENAGIIRALRIMEKCSALVADHVVLANDLWKEPYIRRSADASKVSVLINYVDGKLFAPRPRTRFDDRKIIIFPGSLQMHQGLDVAIRAMPTILRSQPYAELHIYGEGPAKRDLIELSRELGIETQVKFFGYMPTAKVAEVVANADIGVVPKRADCFGNEAFSTKILEFMSVGIPVVASSTRIDRFYFNETILTFFESGNSEALAARALELFSNPERVAILVKNGSSHARINSWENRKADYWALVDRLCSGVDEPKMGTIEGECVSIGS